MDYQKQREYIGSLEQLFSVKDYTFTGGKSQGVRATDIDNGSGLQFTVLADRCMDIGKLSFKGVNFSFLTPTGVVAPTYYDNRGAQWLRSYAAGFVTTCGLSNIGSACEDNGEELGIHGRIANTPADNYSVIKSEEDGQPVVTLQGTMTEARLFGENLTLNRTIKVKYGENKIYMQDEVTNHGYKPAEHMYLWHFNIGYPFLCEDTVIDFEEVSAKPRDAWAEVGFGDLKGVHSPLAEYDEQVFYCKLKKDSENMAKVKLTNKKLGLSVTWNFDHEAMSEFLMWKNYLKGAYVVGIEPANAHVGGRDLARKDGSLKFIKPGETITYKAVIEFKAE